MQYGQSPRRIRVLLGRLTTAAVILSAGAVAAWLTPQAYRHVQRVRLASQCMKYAMPADTVACEFSHDYRNSPLKNDPRYAGDGFGHGLVPAPWRELHRRLYGRPPPSAGTAFLGARRGPGARERRLVTVDGQQPSFTRDSLWLAWRVYDVSNSRRGPVLLSEGDFREPSVRFPLGDDPVRVFAAVADPADESHFTVAVEVNKPGGPYHRRHVIDGWLRDDAVSMVTQNPRDMTTVTPPTPEDPGLWY